LSAIQGELGNEEGLKKAAACGADVFLSFAKPTLGNRNGTVRFSAIALSSTRRLHTLHLKIPPRLNGGSPTAISKSLAEMPTWRSRASRKRVWLWETILF